MNFAETLEQAKQQALSLSPQHVVVFSGGQNTEHEISLTSAKTVVDALLKLGHHVTQVIIDRDGTWRTDTDTGLDAILPKILEADLIFPVMHGMTGEDGVLQGMIEFLGLPYVGSGVEASAIAMAKEVTKTLVQAAGIPVADGTVVNASRIDDIDAHLTALELTYPVFVKASRSGSSYGANRVADVSGLPSAFAEASAIDPIVLIEQEIVGREIDLGVLELPDGTVLVSDPLEILADPDEPFFTAEAKYFSDKTIFQIPADIPETITRALKEAAREAYHTVGCSGFARIDFFVQEDDTIVFNEINTIPGMGPVSQYPRMWKAKGLEYHELIALLVASAKYRRHDPQTNVS